MSAEISGSVGRWEKGARNLQPDVKTVQRLLSTAAKTLKASEIDPKAVDGKISRLLAASDTVKAIEAFQSRFTAAADGIIEIGSQTWTALLQVPAQLVSGCIHQRWLRRELDEARPNGGENWLSLTD